MLSLWLPPIPIFIIWLLIWIGVIIVVLRLIIKSFIFHAKSFQRSIVRIFVIVISVFVLIPHAFYSTMSLLLVIKFVYLLSYFIYSVQKLAKKRWLFFLLFKLICGSHFLLSFFRCRSEFHNRISKLVSLILRLHVLIQSKLCKHPDMIRNSATLHWPRHLWLAFAVRAAGNLFWGRLCHYLEVGSGE